MDQKAIVRVKNFNTEAALVVAFLLNRGFSVTVSFGEKDFSPLVKTGEETLRGMNELQKRFDRVVLTTSSQGK